VGVVSVFDLLSHSDRERLKGARDSVQTLSAATGSAPSTGTPGSHDISPHPQAPQLSRAISKSSAPPISKPDVRTFQASGGQGLVWVGGVKCNFKDDVLLNLFFIIWRFFTIIYD